MSKLQTYKVCYYCNGSGQRAWGMCKPCLGTGRRSIRWLDFGAGVFRSDKVYEAIDHAEYVALPGPNKGYVDAITGLGWVDLNEGSRARTVLWNLFDSESTTKANLVTLIG